MSELVSIVMATYNGERFLRKQVESILKQTYSNFELIVVDDGSNDKTLSILQEFATHDERIKIFPSNENIGFVANFERGLKLTKGFFIAFSDQDDIFRHEKIEVMANVLRNSDADLVISDLKLIDEEGETISNSMWKLQNRNTCDSYSFKRIVHSNFATGCSMMFTRSLMKIATPFPANCLVHDWWMALVALRSNAGGVFIIYDTLTSYRQHSLNTIGAQSSSKISISKNIKILFNGNESNRSIVRSIDNKNHIKRLQGYLALNIWSDKDAIILKNYLELLEGYQADISVNLLIRISKLPRRLFYAFLTKNPREVLQVLYFTIFPTR
jgi:glycosyltransferase involved in cell wall biosynthesis